MIWETSRAERTKALSLLATDTTDATIPGVKDLNAQYQEQFGPGDYRPNLVIAYWGFRAMILFGAIASFGAVVAWWLTRKGRHLPQKKWVRVTSILVIVTPFLANMFGWIFTEMGRQPWVVAPNPSGLPEVRLLTKQAASEAVSAPMVIATLGGFALIYGALMVVEIFLLKRYIQAGPEAVMPPEPEPTDPDDPDTPTDAGDPARLDDERVLAFAY